MRSTLVGALLAVAALAYAQLGTVLARPSGAGERAISDRVKSGTGFFVSPDGFLLTSAHVVAGCQNVSVWDSAETNHRGYVIALDRRLDIALLWAEGVSPRLLASATRMSVQPGEPVVTLGYGVIPNEPLKPVLVEGWLIGDRTALAGNRIIAIQANLHAGHSGGALLARDGSLLGVIVGRDEEHPDHGVAIPEEDFRALLAAYGIVLSRRNPVPNAREIIAPISVLIQCSSR
jgi:S1-C subfamily serine protease